MTTDKAVMCALLLMCVGCHKPTPMQTVQPCPCPDWQAFKERVSERDGWAAAERVLDKHASKADKALADAAWEEARRKTLKQWGYVYQGGSCHFLNGVLTSDPGVSCSVAVKP